MAATNLPKSTAFSSAKLLEQLQRDYPDISFVASRQFSWHAGRRNISYASHGVDDVRSAWAILHELGHALLEHTDFGSDIELLQIEISAWEKAHQLAPRYGIQFDQDYIEDCLDSYRDWLHVRATCPTCYVRCLQTDKHTYTCHNCGSSWRVTRSRLCRPYKKRNGSPFLTTAK